jgi:MinD superfamily P-loop ATPase
MNIAIASGKGGTGKTTVAVNFAAYLSTQTETVLVDLDVEEPNTGLFLNAEGLVETLTCKPIPVWQPQLCTGCGLCSEVCAFNAIIQVKDDILVFPRLCHSCGACAGLCPEQALVMEPQEMGRITSGRSGALSWIESRLNTGEEQAVPQIRETKRFVDRNVSSAAVRVLDAPPGTSCPVVEIMRDADALILITEPTPFGLHDLKLAVSTARGLGKEPFVVMNRLGLGNTETEEYCRSEGIAVIAGIPDDPRIARAYSEGKLLYEEFPAVREALQSMWEYVRGDRKAESADKD